MGNLSFNPMTTTGISGGFVLDTKGYVQGTFLDDPAVRYQLEGAQVDASQSTPIWGGLPIALKVPAVDQDANLPSATVAATLTTIAGWCLFNQASAGIITPSSNVPLYQSGMSMNFARAGSNMRICLPVENTAQLDALVGAAPNVALYWDATNNCLTTTSAGNIGPLPISLEFLSAQSKTVTYNSGTGIATWNPTGAAAIVRI